MYLRKWTKYWRIIANILLVIIMWKLIFLERDSYDFCIQKSGKTLPSFLEIFPKKGKSIFFVETSCKSAVKGKITITARQACAVESAARHHPNSDVYLLFTSPGIFNFKGEQSDENLKVLLSYGNVKIMYLDYGNFIKGTPVEELYTSGKIQQSKHVVSHASDVLRYLILWKYGGIYLDLDVIVLKSFAELAPNYAGLQSISKGASGVLSFEASGKGHSLVEKCLTDLRDGFDQTNWENNGPGVITRLIRQQCDIKNASQVIIGKKWMRVCDGLTVYPPQVFYAIPYHVWNWYFDETKLRSLIFNTKRSYAIHMWNKLSANTTISLNSGVPYLHFAKKYCPKVVESCTEYF